MRPPKNFSPKPYAYHQEIELQIEDLTNLGSGVGRDDNWVVFVPYALPGERVRVRIWRNKKSHSDADLVEILEPSPERREPRCKLFGECGGCQYQHLSYTMQLGWKTEQIRALLKKMTGYAGPVERCKGSEVIYGYRSKITPHFRKAPHLPGVAIGFERAATRSVIDVRECPIASERINAALPAERERLRRGDHAFKRGGTLLLRDSRDGIITDMRARAVEKVGAFEFSFLAGEFFQNNPHVLPMMLDSAIEQAHGEGIRFLVDAYCGVGVFGIWGSARFEKVTGIEVSEAAVEQAKENIQINGIRNMEVHAGKAESLFADLEWNPKETALLLDPPRKGCDVDFIRQLLEFRPARIVYVSCGPDSQARDVRLLMDGGYAVRHVQPFDLFPHTRHIENVLTLTPAVPCQ